MNNKIPEPLINTGYDVSIIVPTYNRANYLSDCLDSLLGQTMPAYEIIVVNDGSTDNTAEILTAYGDKISYIHKENGGKPSAVNMALDVVKGDLVWIFDDDDVAFPDAIEQRVKTLKTNPHAGFVYAPHYLGIDDKHGKITKTLLHDTPNYANDIFFLEILKGCFFHLASALVRLEAYQSVGKFDHTLLSSEDYDMQIRLSRVYPAAFCESPCFIFRQHPGLRGSEEIRYAAEKRSKIFRKYDGAVGLKVRKQLSLNEYLPNCDGNNELSPELKRQALLNRMVIMASKGCIEEMVEDLCLVISSTNEESLPQTERSLISSAITTGYAYEAIREDWPTFKNKVRCLPKNNLNKLAIRLLAKGFFILAISYPGNIRQKTVKFVLALKTLCI